MYIFFQQSPKVLGWRSLVDPAKPEVIPDPR